MANIWLRSTDGNDGNAGTQKEAAKATLAAAMTAAGAGGKVYVSNLHAETQASAMTVASPGTDASPTIVVCVPDWGAATGTTAPTTRSTGATVTVTGAANTLFITGGMYCYGVSFSCAATSGTNIMRLGNSSGATSWLRFENGTFTLASAGNTSIGIGLNGALRHRVEWHNVTVNFADAQQRLTISALFFWTGSSSSVTGTMPTGLFRTGGGGDAQIARVEGVDLSALGSGKAIADLANSNSGELTFADCKLGSSVSLTTGTHPAHGGVIVNFINCDSADTNYRYQKTYYPGTITQETTIVRSGGASDGMTPVSRKMVTTANSKVYSPLESDPITFWNETIGSSITVSVPVVTDGVTLTDAEAWVEVEYLGTSGFPFGLFASDRVSDPIFDSPANQTTDSVSSWTTTGLSSPVKQTLSVSITPQEKGLVRARVMLAKASTTMYYDPKIATATGRQYQTVAGYLNEGQSGGPIIGGSIVRAS